MSRPLGSLMTLLLAFSLAADASLKVVFVAAPLLPLLFRSFLLTRRDRFGFESRCRISAFGNEDEWAAYLFPRPSDHPDGHTSGDA